MTASWRRVPPLGREMAASLHPASTPTDAAEAKPTTAVGSAHRRQSEALTCFQAQGGSGDQVSGALRARLELATATAQTLPRMAETARRRLLALTWTQSCVGCARAWYRSFLASSRHLQLLA